MIMDKDHQIFILSCAEKSLSALKKLTTWADEIHLIYAWANTNNGKAAHWRLLPLDKIKRAVIGIHFAQTEPLALRLLSKLPKILKVTENTSGVFHPKMIIGIKGEFMAAILGSSNLTTGGFSGNTEINVLIKGPKESDIMMKLLNFMDEQWESPRAFEPDIDWLERYEEVFRNRPRPPLVPGKKPDSRTVIQTEDEVNVTWNKYYNLIVKQELRTISNNYEIHIFDHEDGSYMQEVENCQKAFEDDISFAAMSDEDRKLVSGFGGGTTGLFGSMGGAGYFKGIVNRNPEIISKYLDAVPLGKKLSIVSITNYLDGMVEIKGIQLGTATRLLAMKRPDCFLPINDGNRKRIKDIFGPPPSTVSGYIKFHKKLWNFPWFQSPEPNERNQKRVWRARVALLDSVLYEIPEKLL